MINETKLKADLVLEIRQFFPRFVVFRHEDKMSHGQPDISVTGNGTTTWIEAKFANPRFDSKGIQELTMRRLAATSHAFYVVWRMSKNGEISTHIVTPNDIGTDPDEWTDFTNGIDHIFVIDRLKGIHDVDNPE